MRLLQVKELNLCSKSTAGSTDVLFAILRNDGTDQSKCAYISTQYYSNHDSPLRPQPSTDTTRKRTERPGEEYPLSVWSLTRCEVVGGGRWTAHAPVDVRSSPGILSRDSPAKLVIPTNRVVFLTLKYLVWEPTVIIYSQTNTAESTAAVYTIYDVATPR